jgi:hypothetical protein
MHLQEVASMSIMEINCLILYSSCQLHRFTDKLLQQLYGEKIEQLHRWIYILSHVIRKEEYGKQLKVLTGTNGEPRIRKITN